MSEKFNTILFKALALTAVFFTLSISFHLLGFGDIPLLTLLVLPGTFLYKSFALMAYYIPAVIAILTVALQQEGFRRRVLLPTSLSVVPFFTLAALVKINSGADSSPVSELLLNQFGLGGSTLLLAVLTLLEALLISGVTLAVNSGSVTGPSFWRALAAWWGNFFAETLTGRSLETKLLTADHGKGRTVLRTTAKSALQPVSATVATSTADIRQDPFFGGSKSATPMPAGGAITTEPAADQFVGPAEPAAKAAAAPSDYQTQLQTHFPETSSVLKEIDALLARRYAAPAHDTPAPPAADSLLEKAEHFKEEKAVAETLAYIQGPSAAPAQPAQPAVAPLAQSTAAPLVESARWVEPLLVPEPPVPPVFEDEQIIDWDRLPHAELEAASDDLADDLALAEEGLVDDEDEAFDLELENRLKKELASQALVAKVFPVEEDLEAEDDLDDLVLDNSAEEISAIFQAPAPAERDEDLEDPAQFDWKAMDERMRAGQLSAEVKPLEGGNNVAPRMGRVIEANITKDIPFVPTSQRVKFGKYHVPVDGILTAYKESTFIEIDEDTKRSAHVLKMTLKEFNIDADVTGIRKGPVVTMFEILPAAGVKLSKIVALQDNIALGLAATSVRIVAPIPGKHAVGIEVPNKDRAIVGFAEMINSAEFQETKHELPIVLGKDISGDIQIIDLAKTPHLLIAGATGSGKSVSVNTLVCSLLYKRSPDEVRLLMVDPKIVELKFFNDIPHLLAPVITEPKKALQAVQWCLYEMERRYALLDAIGAKDIKSYNAKVEKRHLATNKLPYIVLVVDEFADLMATSGKDLEGTLARLAAMSRAVGIHLVLATQRPSIDVITGLIKANFPSRIAFMVASKTDSRIIIDSMGAEKLLGRGDMLFTSSWNPFPSRIQGAFLSEDEVERVVSHVKTLGEPDYISDEIFFDDEEEVEKDSFASDEMDPLFEKALEIVRSQKKASASFLQRRLGIGYNRAARLVETMEEMGFVGPQNGSKPREIVHSV